MDLTCTLEEKGVSKEKRTSTTDDVVEAKENFVDLEPEDLQEDDPYEYDEDIRPSAASDIYEERSFLDLDPCLGQSSAGEGPSVPTTRIGAPCWDCKGCTLGTTPLFLLGSPAEAPCTCVSCQ
ncbi:hypothetical protein KM043_013958 [Ampulex compressa]|nr:hypothetical protein KM043_013958 [Ampulex compressa]